MLVIEKGDVKTINTLIAKGFNINESSRKNGKELLTPLNHAILLLALESNKETKNENLLKQPNIKIDPEK
ncbi:MAG: hypothetical protein MRQ09_01590 [Candidatus Midichloria sp.]|nr:hypothetical protein [Candidatus Midichloria sp.]